MNISKIHTTNASLKLFLLTIAIISILLLSYPARAESGTIVVSDDTNAVYNYSVGTGNNINSLAGFFYFNFDYKNYSTLTNYTIYDPENRLTFSEPNEITAFTITINGSGHGYASYSQFLHTLTWVFSSDTVITGSPFNISYTNDIFRNVTYGPANKMIRFHSSISNEINATHPMALGNTSEMIVGTLSDQLVPTTYRAFNMSGIFSAGATTTFYNFTYPASGYYLANISKSGQLTTTKYYLHTQTNQTSGYYAEATFNTNDSQVLMTQLDGIYLNVTLASGNFLDRLINASGSTLAPLIPPNASDPDNPNCPVNCITTSKPTYNNTESVNVYGSFYPATTTVTDCLFFGFICTDTTISTESTTGYVFISTQGSTSPIKFIPFTPDLNHNYNLFTNLDIGTYQAQLWGFAGPGTTCPGGLVYDFDPTGKQGVPLGCYYPHNITNFNVVNASGNLSIVWQTKFSNSTVVYGDTVTVAWSNVTANDTVRIYDEDHVLLQSYNINQSTVSQIPVFIPLFHIGQFNATIFNGSNVLHNATAYLNVVPPGSVDVANQFNITMYWSKAADVINTPTFLNWNTGTYTGNYNISILKDGTEVRRNSYYGVPGQTQQASYTFGEQGAYIAQFLDFPNQTVQAQADIFISATTTTGGGTGGTTNESGNNLVGSSNLILNIPWIGLMVLIVVIFGLVKNNVQGGNFVFAVAITTSIEAVIGLWEEWGIYITVLSWLLVGVFFKLNKAIEV